MKHPRAATGRTVNDPRQLIVAAREKAARRARRGGIYAEWKIAMRGGAMITDLAERLRLTLEGEDITLSISHADIKRLRMWIDRMNADEAQGGYSIEPQDPDDPSVIEVAILTCLDIGLRVDEVDHGLEAFPWGDVVSLEVAREMERRGEAP